MNNDSRDSGLPTRAVHEAYLDMQRALKQYRSAKDTGDDTAISRAHGDVQESVITFFELLRPYLRDNDTVAKYWEGRPPNYPGNGHPPDPRDGHGILQVQERTEVVPVEDSDVEDLDGLQDWHDELGLNGNVRLKMVQGQGESAVVSYQAYQLGLQHIDDWETKYETERSSYGGFLGDKQSTTKRQVRVDMPRLKRAARELATAAKDMGFLSDIETPTNDDPLPV